MEPAAVESQVDPYLQIGAWLSPDKSQPDCLMVSSALEDDTHAWLWLELHLGDARCARVLGRGALIVVVRSDGGELRLFDEGIRIPLEDGNTFLNSAGGPISIRDSEMDGTDATVKLLLALPGADIASSEVLRVETVAGRWIYRR